MANDPSMPPSEQSPNVSVNTSPNPSPNTQTVSPSEPGTGGVVAIPKPVFEAVYALVVQLASGLYQIKTHSDGQAPAQELPVTQEAMPPEGPEMAPPAEGALEQSDEEFLKGLAEQGNKR
jgi:hypothetical protein